METDTVQPLVRWSLMWRTPSMSAPAFWYYTTCEEAQTAAATLSVGTVWEINSRVCWGVAQ